MGVVVVQAGMKEVVTPAFGDVARPCHWPVGPAVHVLNVVAAEAGRSQVSISEGAVDVDAFGEDVLYGTRISNAIEMSAAVSKRSEILGQSHWTQGFGKTYLL